MPDLTIIISFNYFLQPTFKFYDFPGQQMSTDPGILIYLSIYIHVDISMNQTYMYNVRIHNTCWSIATDSIATEDGGWKGENELNHGKY